MPKEPPLTIRHPRSPPPSPPSPPPPRHRSHGNWKSFIAGVLLSSAIASTVLTAKDVWWDNHPPPVSTVIHHDDGDTSWDQIFIHHMKTHLPADVAAHSLVVSVPILMARYMSGRSFNNDEMNLILCYEPALGLFRIANIKLASGDEATRAEGALLRDQSLRDVLECLEQMSKGVRPASGAKTVPQVEEATAPKPIAN